VLVLVLECELRVLDLRLQACVARQPDDVVHARALAPVDDALAAKARVASEDKAHVGPHLTQPRDQQLQNSRGVLCAVDAAGPQVRAQQLLAAEHVQRQVAVAVVVAVEEAALLLAVQRVVGGVEVQHQFLGRDLEAGNELLDQNPVQAPRGGAVGPLLQSAQRRGAGHFAIHAHGCLHGHVLAQRAVIVQILPAECQPVHALAQHVAHAVLDEQRAARVGDAVRGRLDQPELAIDLAQQQHPAVACHAATVEAALHHTSAKTAELDRPNLNFFGTVWLRHCPLAHQDSTPR
jgi:hypothetical protein